MTKNKPRKITQKQKARAFDLLYQELDHPEIFRKAIIVTRAFK